MYKTGYSFIGWYTSEDGAGEPVTEIGTQAEDVVLYAKWFEGCAVTAENYMYANFADSNYGDAYTILLFGEWTDDAFADFCSRLKSAGISPERAVTLDMSEISGVTTIGGSAFSWCSSLKEITLSKNLTSIDKYVFYDCISLTEITLPDGAESIGDYAFSDCTLLTKITIPAKVSKIDLVKFSV